MKHRVALQESPSFKSPEIGILQVGQIVEVLSVERSGDRFRGRTADGWFSLCAPDRNYFWAERFQDPVRNNHFLHKIDFLCLAVRDFEIETSKN